MALYCSNCGTEAAPSSRFCGSCGTSLARPVARTPDQAGRPAAAPRQPATPVVDPDATRPALVQRPPAGPIPRRPQPSPQHQSQPQRPQQSPSQRPAPQPYQQQPYPPQAPQPTPEQQFYVEHVYPEQPYQPMAPPPPYQPYSPAGPSGPNGPSLDGVPPNLGVTWRSGQTYAGLPAEVWLPIALLAYPVLLFVWRALQILRNGLGSGLPFEVTLMILLVALAQLFLAAAIGGVIWTLHQGAPTGRILGYVTAALLLWSVVYDGSRGSGLAGIGYGGGASAEQFFLVLAAVGVGTVLTMLPAVTEWFERSAARVPVDLTAARAVCVVLAVLAAVDAAISLLGIRYQGRNLVYAVLAVATAALLGVAARQLGSGSQQARMIACIGAGVAFVSVAIEHDRTWAGLMLGAAIAVPVLLYAREPTRTFFSRRGRATSS